MRYLGDGVVLSGPLRQYWVGFMLPDGGFDLPFAALYRNGEAVAALVLSDTPDGAWSAVSAWAVGATRLFVAPKPFGWRVPEQYQLLVGWAS